MNDEELDQLFRAARPTDETIVRREFGFETRLMARIRASRDETPWLAWALRLSPAFLSVVAACGWWAVAAEKDLRVYSAQSDSATAVAFIEAITGKSI